MSRRPNDGLVEIAKLDRDVAVLVSDWTQVADVAIATDPDRRRSGERPTACTRQPLVKVLRAPTNISVRALGHLGFAAHFEKRRALLGRNRQTGFHDETSYVSNICATVELTRSTEIEAVSRSPVMQTASRCRVVALGFVRVSRESAAETFVGGSVSVWLGDCSMLVDDSARTHRSAGGRTFDRRPESWRKNSFLRGADAPPAVARAERRAADREAQGATRNRRDSCQQTRHRHPGGHRARSETPAASRRRPTHFWLVDRDVRSHAKLHTPHTTNPDACAARAS